MLYKLATRPVSGARVFDARCRLTDVGWGLWKDSSIGCMLEYSSLDLGGSALLVGLSRYLEEMLDCRSDRKIAKKDTDIKERVYTARLAGATAY